MVNDDLIRDVPEELTKRGSRTDPIKSRDLYVQGKRWRLRSYKPEMMKELCTIPGEIILGDNKFIENYEPGNMVLGSIGKEVSVLKTFNRNYNGSLIKIKASGMLPISVTPNHPILVVNGKQRYVGDSINLSAPIWKDARDIFIKKLERDYLLVPVINGEKDINKISLESYIGIRYGKKWKSKLHDFPLNIDTAWLLGLYVAEGSWAGLARGISFSLSKNETELHKKIIKISNSLGHKGEINQLRTAVQVMIRSAALGRACVDWCGRRARNKKIPDFILYNKNIALLSSFISGYEIGDGYRWKNKNRAGKEYDEVTCSTTSKILGLQLQLANIRLGRWANLYKRIIKPGLIEGRKTPQSDIYVVTHGFNHFNGRHKSINNFIISPIIKIDNIDYNGSVFNLETEDNSFLISNAIVHNCNSCSRIFICDHILQPMPSKDGQQLCIEYQPHPSTRTCVICGSLNKIAVDSVRCWKCGTLLIKPGPGLRIKKVRITEEGEIRKILKRNITE